MSRFILIDNASGYIWGDTADIGGRIVACETAVDAARALDRSICVYDRTYEEVSSLASNETGYLVYRADINGSEAVPVVHDGQSQEEIDAVTSSCELVARVRCSSAED